MAHAKIAKRLLAMLLCVIMVASMLPVSALAFLLPVSRAASGPDYTVRFVKDPFTTKEIGVYTVVGDGDSTSLKIQGATLDNVSLQIGEDSMTVADLTAGYGLLNVEVGGTRYYLTGATWGTSTAITESFTFEDVQAHANDGIYLHYQAASDVQIAVTAVDGNSNDTVIVSGNITPGVIDETVAQKLVEGQPNAWYFDRAELRSKTGNKVVPINSIQLENGYYYVQTDVAEQAMVAFSPDAWGVYLVYEPARTLTINLTRSNEAGDLNKIDGTGIMTLAPGDTSSGTGTVTYQTPVGTPREIHFTIGSGGNLKLTEQNGSVIFDNAVNGYEIKSYTYNFTGSSDVTINAEFQGTTHKYLDYSHRYGNKQESYHGAYIYLNDSQLTDTATDKVEIRKGDEIKIGYGNLTGGRYVPNVLVINNTYIDLPWPNVAYQLDNLKVNELQTFTAPDTKIYDDANNLQATIGVKMKMQVHNLGGTATFTNQCFLELTIKTIANNLKIDFYNNASITGGEVRVIDVRDAVLYNRPEDPYTFSVFPVGQGFNNGTKFTMYADVQWDTYVENFILRSPAGTNQWSEQPFEFCNVSGDGPGGQSATINDWYGDKAWFFSHTGNNQNTAKINGFQQAKVVTKPVNFRYVYCLPLPNNTSQYAEIADSSTFIFADGAANTRTDTGGFEYEGKIFLGWSLNQDGSGTVTQPGQPVLRDVVDKAYKQDKSVVQYGETAQATIRLYPVFADTTDIDYTSYTVTIHTDGDSYYTATGIAGSMVDRESVLALPEVASRLAALGEDWVLDGARSDSMVTLSHGTTNEFHLYYNTTANVDITFASKYGFVEQTTTADDDGYHRVTVQAAPNNAMNLVEIPTPNEEEVNASFVGWNTDPQAVVGFTSTELQNTVVPSQNTTYYAIYVPDVTLTFYTWSPEGQWSDKATTITVKNGQTISSENGTTIGNLEKSYEGYTFQGWIPGAIFGTPTDHDALMRETFTSDTTFYASYQAESNVTLRFDANGGSFPEGASVSGGSLNKEKTVLTYENQTVDSTVTPPQPTPSGSKTFVGWSTDNSDTVGAMSVTVTPAGGTYYALWIDTALTVSVNDPNNIIYDGTEKEPELMVKLGDTVISKGDYTVNYNGTNINAGTAVGTVTVTNGVHRGKAGMVTFTIQPRDIKAATVGGINGSYPYDGGMITPEVTVTDSTLPEGTQITSKTLTPGTHYTVTYGDGERNNTDVAKGGVVTITGIGNYEGSVTQTFSIIVDQSVSLTIMPIVDYEVNYKDQDGKYTAVRPDGLTDDKVLVYDSHMRVLDSTTEYDIIWPADWDVGQKALRVEGKGNYAGKEASVTFRITAKSVNLKLTVTPMVMEVGGGDPTITVTAQPSGTQLTKDTHYKLSYMKYNEQSNGYETSSEGAMKTDPGIYRVTATGINEYQGATGQHVFVRTQRTANEDGYAVSIPNLTGLVYDGTDHNQSGKLLDNIQVEKQKEEPDGEWEIVNPTSITINSITRTRGGTSESITVTDGTDLQHAPWWTPVCTASR